MQQKGFKSTRVLDPGGFDPNSGPTLKKKPDPDPTYFPPNKIRPQRVSSDIRVNIIDLKNRSRHGCTTGWS